MTRDVLLLLFGIPCVLIGAVELAMAFRRRGDWSSGWTRRDVFHRTWSHGEYNGRQLLIEACLGLVIGGLMLGLRFSQ